MDYDSKERVYILVDKEEVTGTIAYKKGGVIFNGKRLPKPKPVKGKKISKKYYVATSSIGTVGEPFLKSRVDKLKSFKIGTKFKRNGDVVL